jgi:rubredoxin
MNAFEGGYHYSDTGLSPQAVLECKICWTVYDPAKGCDFRQIDPGTPFTNCPRTGPAPPAGRRRPSSSCNPTPARPPCWRRR